MILVIQAGGEVTCLKEKELTSKLELLYNKSLYLLALNLAQSQKVNQPLLIAGLHACPHAAWIVPHSTQYMDISRVLSMPAESAQVQLQQCCRAKLTTTDFSGMLSSLLRILPYRV